MTVAAAAYPKLHPSVKRKVAALLKLNPDYMKWVAQAAPGDDTDLTAFVVAATWPDAIKTEAGYTSDGWHPTGTATDARNIGYEDHLQHRYWHFYDTPFSPDQTPLKAADPVNAQSEIAVLRTALGSPASTDSVKSYDLVWLEHLVGDVHQPLHAVSRFDQSLPEGDQGGNLVLLAPDAANGAQNLHWFWDSALGVEESQQAAVSGAGRLPPAPQGQASVTDERQWMAESAELAKKVVYVSPVVVGPGPFTLDAAYRTRAHAVAAQRVSLAGARLANLLNDALK
jgi:hypothetical protein